MFNNNLIKITGSFLFLIILCFGLASCVYAEDLGMDKVSGEKSSIIEFRTLKIISDDDDIDDDDDSDDLDEDDSDDLDDEFCENCQGPCEFGEDCINQEYSPKYYHFEWKGVLYYIDLEEFNLTDDELTELFTKRDDLREKIANLTEMIEKMELSRSDHILLAIDELYEVINKIMDNSEFNDLLLSLKNCNISDVNSIFHDLKKLLESIKDDFPDEDFSEIDLLMANLEIMLNEELGLYENLTLELKDNYALLGELLEKYPFLGQQIVLYSDIARATGAPVSFAGADEKNAEGAEVKNKKVDSENNNEMLLEMKKTGIPFFSVALLLLLSLIGLTVKRRF